MAKRTRTTCPRCNRDVAIIGKRDKLAKHKCKPTPETVMCEAEAQERYVRLQLRDSRKMAAQGRAWTFRLLALMVVLFIGDVFVYTALGHGLIWAEAVVLIALASVALANVGRWQRGTYWADQWADRHEAAVLAVEKAQQAVNRAAMPELYGPATDLDNLE